MTNWKARLVWRAFLLYVQPTKVAGVVILSAFAAHAGLPDKSNHPEPKLD